MGYKRHLRPSFLESLGHKVKHGLVMFGQAKGLYDTGKAVFSAYKAMSPMISQAVAYAPYVL